MVLHGSGCAVEAGGGQDDAGDEHRNAEGTGDDNEHKSAVVGHDDLPSATAAAAGPVLGAAGTLVVIVVGRRLQPPQAEVRTRAPLLHRRHGKISVYTGNRYCQESSATTSNRCQPNSPSSPLSLSLSRARADFKTTAYLNRL